MAHVGETIEHPLSGERLTFLKTSATTGGAFPKARIEMAPRGSLPRPHTHPRGSEEFEVAEGRVQIEISGRRRVAEAGETVVVPKGGVDRQSKPVIFASPAAGQAYAAAMRWRPLAAAGLVAGLTALTPGPPAHAQPMDPIPGEGFFVVGPDVGLGLYRTDGTASIFGVWINDVPTQDSMCLWFTYSTPGPDKAHVVATNMSIGPMYANINPAVKSFESHNCQSWIRVP